MKMVADKRQQRMRYTMSIDICGVKFIRPMTSCRCANKTSATQL